MIRLTTGCLASVAALVVLTAVLMIGGMVAFAGHPEYVVPLAAIIAIVALLWRPVSVLTRWLEQRATMSDSVATVRDVVVLQRQLDALRKEHAELQETVRWQEQFLLQAAGEPLKAERVGARLHS